MRKRKEEKIRQASIKANNEIIATLESEPSIRQALGRMDEGIRTILIRQMQILHSHSVWLLSLGDRYVWIA